MRHWIGISTTESRKILLPVWPKVTLKVISRSNIDIILKIQHFERRFQRAGPMTFKVTLQVTGVSFAPPNKQASTKFLLIRTTLDQTWTMVCRATACHQLEKPPYLLGRRVRVITCVNTGSFPAGRPQGVVSYLIFCEFLKNSWLVFDFFSVRLSATAIFRWSLSLFDIILKNQYFENRFQRAGPMTFKVTLKVTGVNFGLLFGTLAHICTHHKNARNSLPGCFKVLFLALQRVSCESSWPL